MNEQEPEQIQNNEEKLVQCVGLYMKKENSNYCHDKHEFLFHTYHDKNIN